MDTISLSVRHRDVLGKKVRGLRLTGLTPINLFGKGLASRSLQADAGTIASVISRVGRNIPLSLVLKDSDEQALVFVSDVQYHPVTNNVLHVDFYQVDLDRRMRRDVPIALLGEAPAVRTYNAMLTQGLHHLSVECLPMEMPELIEIDITILEELDQSIRVSDYVPPPNVTILSDQDDLVVRVMMMRAQVDEGTGVGQLVEGEDQTPAQQSDQPVSE